MTTPHNYPTERCPKHPNLFLWEHPSRSAVSHTYIAFLSDGSLPNIIREAEKVQRTVARFWLSKVVGCTGIRLEDHTCFVFIPAKLRSCWLSFMREYVVATWGVGHSHTNPWLKDSSGRICNEKQLTLLKDVIGARGMHLCCTYHGEISTQSSILGLSPNGG